MKKRFLAMLISIIMVMGMLMSFAISVNAEEYTEKTTEFVQKQNSADNTIENEYRTGLVFTDDIPEYKPEEQSFSLFGENALPSSIDLSEDKYFPGIGNQGNIGSCASWATTYYQFGYQAAKVNDWTANTDEHRYSPRFTNNFANFGANNGSSLYENYDILKKQGAVTMSEFPYTNSGLETEYLEWCTDTEALRKALNTRVSTQEYKYFADPNIQTPITAYDDSDLNEMKQLLQQGKPLVISTHHMYSWQYVQSAEYGSIVPYALDIDLGINDSHALCIIGYDDSVFYDLNENGTIEEFEKGAFKLANSWGTSWGNDGFIWVMYDAFNILSNADNLNYPNRMDISGTFAGILTTHYVYTTIEVQQYEPQLVAEVEVSTAARINLKVYLTELDNINGKYRPSIVRSCDTILNAVGSFHSFAGTNTETTGTFVFDFGPILTDDWESREWGVVVMDAGLDYAGITQNTTVYSVKIKSAEGYNLNIMPNDVFSGGRKIYGRPGNISNHGYNYAVVDGGAILEPIEILYNDGSGYTMTALPAFDNPVDNISIPDTLDGYPVVGIGYYAFINCKKLTSVTLPDSLLRIESFAFWYCTGLTNVFTENVEYIGESAFTINTSFMQNFPSGLNYIGKVAFKYAGEMPENTSITLLEGTTQIYERAFYNYIDLTHIEIPDSVADIGEQAFHKTGLTDISIPASVSSIGYHAGPFRACYELENILVDENNLTFSSVDGVLYNKEKTVLYQVPPGKKGKLILENTLEDDEDQMSHWFHYSMESAISLGLTAKGLTEIVIPDNNPYYSSIDGVVYSKDKTLLQMFPRAKTGHITIPDSVRNILSMSFYECSELTSVTIGSSVTSIGDNAFSGCSGLKSLTIPDNITNIGPSAFSDCTGLESIIFADNINLSPYREPERMFYNCTSLTSVTLGGLNKVYDQMFSSCRSLKSIVIPKNIVSVGWYAFAWCSLKDVYFLSKTPPSIGSEAFVSTAYDAQVTVPSGATAYGTEGAKWHGMTVTFSAPSNILSVAVNGNNSVAVGMDNPQKSSVMLIVAVYDQNNKLLAIKAEAAPQNDLVVIDGIEIPTANGTVVKAILWDDLRYMEPLCDYKATTKKDNIWISD